MPSCVYGPVPSRRLGRSLGVDLVPFKTCSYDCIYCQLGRTTNKTIDRKSWLPPDIVLQQVKKHLAAKPDWITLAGAGEPTLYADIEDLINRIKGITDIPVAVLTNGSLLWSPEVRNALRMADMVAPSLDAGNPELFQFVNRPHESIAFYAMVRGLVDFRLEYTGQYWLEVLLLGSITGLPAPVEEIAKIVDEISPDRVQLNTAVRPPAESFVMPVSEDLMECFATAFGDRAEVIAEFREQDAETFAEIDPTQILDLVRRRPCTLEDISNFLGMHRIAAMKYIEKLTKDDQVKCEYHSNKLFFSAMSAPDRDSK